MYVTYKRLQRCWHISDASIIINRTSITEAVLLIYYVASLCMWR